MTYQTVQSRDRSEGDGLRRTLVNGIVATLQVELGAALDVATILKTIRDDVRNNNVKKMAVDIVKSDTEKALAIVEDVSPSADKVTWKGSDKLPESVRNLLGADHTLEDHAIVTAFSDMGSENLLRFLFPGENTKLLDAEKVKKCLKQMMEGVAAAYPIKQILTEKRDSEALTVDSWLKEAALAVSKSVQGDNKVQGMLNEVAKDIGIQATILYCVLWAWEKEKLISESASGNIDKEKFVPYLKKVRNAIPVEILTSLGYAFIHFDDHSTMPPFLTASFASADDGSFSNEFLTDKRPTALECGCLGGASSAHSLAKNMRETYQKDFQIGMEVWKTEKSYLEVKELVNLASNSLNRLLNAYELVNNAEVCIQQEIGFEDFLNGTIESWVLVARLKTRVEELSSSLETFPSNSKSTKINKALADVRDKLASLVDKFPEPSTLGLAPLKLILKKFKSTSFFIGNCFVNSFCDLPRDAGSDAGSVAGPDPDADVLPGVQEARDIRDLLIEKQPEIVTIKNGVAIYLDKIGNIDKGMKSLWKALKTHCGENVKYINKVFKNLKNQPAPPIDLNEFANNWMMTCIPLPLGDSEAKFVKDVRENVALVEQMNYQKNLSDEIQRVVDHIKRNRPPNPVTHYGPIANLDLGAVIEERLKQWSVEAIDDYDKAAPAKITTFETDFAQEDVVEMHVARQLGIALPKRVLGSEQKDKVNKLPWVHVDKLLQLENEMFKHEVLQFGLDVRSADSDVEVRDTLSARGKGTILTLQKMGQAVGLDPKFIGSQSFTSTGKPNQKCPRLAALGDAEEVHNANLCPYSGHSEIPSAVGQAGRGDPFIEELVGDLAKKFRNLDKGFIRRALAPGCMSTAVLLHQHKADTRYQPRMTRQSLKNLYKVCVNHSASWLEKIIAWFGAAA